MSEKRIRGFLRISMTARTGRVIHNYIVNRTFEDHAKKCVGRVLNEPCPHAPNLAGSRAVDTGLVVGKKRATLDLMCPYELDDPEEQKEHILTLERLAGRIKDLGHHQKEQVQKAMTRICDEILAYARRNPMVVIAEAASLPRGSRARKAD